MIDVTHHIRVIFLHDFVELELSFKFRQAFMRISYLIGQLIKKFDGTTGYCYSSKSPVSGEQRVKANNNDIFSHF